MKKMHMVIVLAAVLALLIAGCNNMSEQPRLETYGTSPNFDTAAREILPEAVPVNHLREDEALYFGTEDGELVEEIPIEVDHEVLLEGQRKFEAFCTPCHGYDGYGEGIVSLEGYPQPASYHTDDLRQAQVGRIYQAIANGKGNMYSYASRISVEDRWAVVAYVRALQLSQNAALDDLPSELQSEFDAVN
jgi:mono/diheme cytochrome c family protein